ncbi:MAG: glycosyltransferase family 39 protein [Candidatus Omnitrophica bacterium]|nr:glycosyltransferase family 39 protein [Candidatus Omnitrophota bacterium]
MLKKTALVLILLAVVVFNVLRFWKLDSIPYGYHVDEVGSADTVQCFAQMGCDVELDPWPLFGSMEYGQDKPPTYVYPGIIWAKIFGATVPSLRGYSVFMLLVGILGLFFLTKKLFGKAAACVVVLAATCSPWAWVVTRVALESYFAPTFAVWGLYFFWRSGRWWDWAIAGFLFSCAMYSYPPARLQIPLMMITLLWYDWRRRPIRWPPCLSLSVVFILSLLPMVEQYINGGLARRFNDISIWNKDYLHSIGSAGTPWDIFRIFIHNYLLHLTPNFLFLTGDPSYVHSTRHLGIFSWFDIAALVILLVFGVLAVVRRSWAGNPVVKHKCWLVFLAVNFFIGIIPSALTNQELPHALRICGSWPFMMLFTGCMWYWAAECVKALWPVLALVGILSGAVLVYQYFTIYPVQSKGMFDYWIKDAAESLKTREDWKKFLLVFHRQNYHCIYFMEHRLGLTCKQAHDIWWGLYRELQARHEW